MFPMAKKQYSEDYETVITTDEKGNEKKTAVYRGEYFSLPIDEAGLKAFKRNALFLLIGIVVLHFGSGFINNPGMNRFYISLPYVGAFFPMLYLVVSYFRLPEIKSQYRRDEIGLSLGRMKSSSAILLTFLIVTLLGEIAYLLLTPPGNQTLDELLYLGLEILTAAAVFLLMRLMGQIHILPIADNTKKIVS